jgi:hypothetical protein
MHSAEALCSICVDVITRVGGCPRAGERWMSGSQTAPSVGPSLSGKGPISDEATSTARIVRMRLPLPMGTALAPPVGGREFPVHRGHRASSAGNR